MVLKSPKKSPLSVKILTLIYICPRLWYICSCLRKTNEYYLKLWRNHQSYKYKENSIYNLSALCRNGRKQSISIYLFINIIRKWEKIVNINTSRLPCYVFCICLLTQQEVVTPYTWRNFVNGAPTARVGQMELSFLQKRHLIYKLSVIKQKTGQKTGKNPPKKGVFISTSDHLSNF